MTFQQSPYLRDQRQFPNDEVKSLSNQMDQTYIDIASKVNARTIGLFANNFQIVTGESWYLGGSSQRKQALRQVYTFTAAGTIAHGINFADVFKFTKPSGSFTDNANPTLANWYGVIWASNVPIAGQISFYVDPTNIVILAGAGAPAIVSGIIVLEWISSTSA